MPFVWLSDLGKSLLPKPQSSDSTGSKVTASVGVIRTTIPETSASIGCLPNLKDVIHKGRRSSRCDPSAVAGRSEHTKPKFSNKVVLDKLGPSVKTVGFAIASARGSGGGDIKGLVEHKGRNMVPRCGLLRSMPAHSRRYDGGSTLVCQTCGERHDHSSAVDSPRLCKHAVSELVEGDSSRKIVEIICRSGADSNTNERTKIERILKVHNNTQNILTRFEDYSETVKVKANRSESKKTHLRCLADGNELLRFHATNVSCSLGMNGSSSLCKSNTCGACRILRNGFSSRKDSVGRVGIFVTSTGCGALKYGGDQGGCRDHFERKALFVCRVIAGKILSSSRKFDPGFSCSSVFDSLAWKSGRSGIAEELFLLNPRALLPCFFGDFQWGVWFIGLVWFDLKIKLN